MNLTLEYLNLNLYQKIFVFLQKHKKEKIKKYYYKTI